MQRLVRNKLIGDNAQARLAGDDQEWRMTAGFAITAPCAGNNGGWHNLNRTSVIIKQSSKLRHDALQEVRPPGGVFSFDFFKAFCSYHPEMIPRGQIVFVVTYFHRGKEINLTPCGEMFEPKCSSSSYIFLRLDSRQLPHTACAPALHERHERRQPQNKTARRCCVAMCKFTGECRQKKSIRLAIQSLF